MAGSVDDIGPNVVNVSPTRWLQSLILYGFSFFLLKNAPYGAGSDLFSPQQFLGMRVDLELGRFLMAELLEVIAGGERVASLEAIRDRLAAELIVTEGAAVASIAKQLTATIELLSDSTVAEGSTVDEISRRRADRIGSGLSDSSAVG